MMSHLIKSLHFLQIQLFLSLVVIELVDNMTIIVDLLQP